MPGSLGPLLWRWRRTRPTLHATLTRCRLAPLNPHISADLPLCLHEKHTPWSAARAAVLQPCARHPASRERRSVSNPHGVSCAPCAARRAHHSPTEPEESQQRYKDPLPGGARSAITRYGAPAPCRVAAPRSAGLRGRATLPQLDWGRPARVACEFCDLAPARLGPSSLRSVRVLRPRPS